MSRQRRKARRGTCNEWHLEKSFSWCLAEQEVRKAELDYLMDTFGITRATHLMRAGR